MPWIASVAMLLVLAVVPASASARGSNANVAALQVALRALHHYGGAVDGLRGPQTKGAVRRFQSRHHLAADGIAGPQTRRALGRRGAPLLGHRIMQRGSRGWDVAALQFMLRRRGFDPGGVDGGYGANTESAVRRLQSYAGLAVDGRAGHATLGAVRSGRRSSSPSHSSPSGTPSGPVRFLRPLNVPIGDGFGYPGGRRHDGVDMPAPAGTRVGAAGVGVVTFAGWNSGGYGNLMIIRHRLGYETWYAHLSGFAVRSGASVSGGRVIAYVGTTGHSTGPHLHFEVRHNGVPINPVPLLLARSSLGKPVFAGAARRHSEGDCHPGDSHETAASVGRVSPRTAKLAGC
jgi:peptidoglycan hydrolase-like protein with peptidoglycan-binding domain